MEFAICNETFGDWPLEKSLAFAAEAGYRGWEVAPFMLTENILTWSSGKRNDYASAVREAGLELVGLHWLLAKTTGYHLTSPDRQVRVATAAYLRSLVQLCADLGGKVMVFGSPMQRNLGEGVSQEQGSEFAAETFAAIGETLRACGVKLAIEPLGPQETNFLNTAEEARRLIERIGSEMVGLHLDMKAMSSEAKPIPELIAENRDLLIHFHANDPNRQGPGMGTLPVAPVLDALERIAYRGWVSVEVFDYSPGIESLVLESIRNLREALARRD